MNSRLNRKEFIKISVFSSLGLFTPQLFLNPSSSSQDAAEKNILVIVYDALTASNIPFYGYPRNTMPFLSRLIDRGIVYYNHFAAGNFTTPGTASLLTGVHPWTHRALQFDDTVIDEYTRKNIFQAFSNYHRMAYSHNPLANTLLKTFRGDIQNYIPWTELLLQNSNPINHIFTEDDDIAYIAWIRTLERKHQGHAYSLFISSVYEKLLDQYIQSRIKSYENDYPDGLPVVRGNPFILDHATNFMMDLVGKSPQPFLGYFHFLPPHEPYHPPKGFFGSFRNDGYIPLEKPEGLFGKIRRKYPDDLNQARRKYDEYILYVDAEFARFYEFMEQSGALENTWIVLTSDHGEMFERGILGHGTPLLYQPLVRIPLIIFEPGRKERLDILSPTSAIDILPTLSQINGKNIPIWCEGSVLPPFADVNATRKDNVISMELRNNPKNQPISSGTFSLIKPPYKLITYLGYPDLEGEGTEILELYDVENDPEELNDLHITEKKVVEDMLAETHRRLTEANNTHSS